MFIDTEKKSELSDISCAQRVLFGPQAAIESGDHIFPPMAGGLTAVVMGAISVTHGFSLEDTFALVSGSSAAGYGAVRAGIEYVYGE